MSGRSEVDDPLKPVYLVDDDVKPAVEFVRPVLAPADERVARGVQLVVVVAEGVGGDEAERHRLDELYEEAVAADVRDDGGEGRLLLLRELALEELEELDLDAL